MQRITASGLRRGAAVLAVAILTLLNSTSTSAQSTDALAGDTLTGVLLRIKATGVVRIGHRVDAIPFSFVRAGRPNGYSIELCEAIVEDITREIGVTQLRIEYRAVTPADRIDQVTDGRVDLECGATTNTAERRARVAFSPLIFVSGTRLLVPRGSPVRSLRGLGGRQVVAVRGTTNAAVVRQLAAKATSPFTVLEADDYAQALAQLRTRQADALAADDILILGYLAEHGLRPQYSVVGELLSYEPYGIMFARGDAPLATVVEATFRRLATTREIRWIYNRWFVRSLPSGERLNVPMGVQLERSLQLLGLPPE